MECRPGTTIIWTRLLLLMRLCIGHRDDTTTKRSWPVRPPIQRAQFKFEPTSRLMSSVSYYFRRGYLEEQKPFVLSSNLWTAWRFTAPMIFVCRFALFIRRRTVFDTAHRDIRPGAQLLPTDGYRLPRACTSKSHNVTLGARMGKQWPFLNSFHFRSARKTESVNLWRRFVCTVWWQCDFGLCRERRKSTTFSYLVSWK